MHIRLQAMLLNLKSFRLFRAACSTPAVFRFSCAPWTNFFTPKSVRGSPPSSPPKISALAKLKKHRPYFLITMQHSLLDSLTPTEPEA